MAKKKHFDFYRLFHTMPVDLTLGITECTILLKIIRIHIELTEAQVKRNGHDHHDVDLLAKLRWIEYCIEFSAKEQVDELKAEMMGTIESFLMESK